MEPRPDDALVRLVGEILAGRPEAIDAWYRREHPLVYRLCYGLVADAAEAEDAAQEAMLRLFDRLGSWDSARPFAGWRNAVVVNLCRDRLRRVRARARIERAAAGHAPRDEAPEHDAPPRRAEAAELAERLRLALACLTPREREVFCLRELEGESTAEVGRALGITEGAVRSLVTLARRRLRERLAPQAADGAGTGTAGHG